MTPALIDDYVHYFKGEKKLQRSTICSYINPVRGAVKLGYVRGCIGLKSEQITSPPVPRNEPAGAAGVTSPHNLHADEKRLRNATDDVGDALFGEDL